MNKILILSIALFSTQISAQYSSFNHNGQSRQYIYYEPENIADNAPLVFVMHGYTSDASVIRNYSGMNDIAEEEGFAVCYPRGTVDNYGNRFWNVGYDFHPNETVDDVDFLKELASYLQQENNLSTINTFATGMSNGGEMCYMLACQASDTFKAVTSVAGMMLQEIMDTCSPENLIPIFEIHGTSDYVNIYAGDPTSSGGWGAYPSIPDTIDYWVGLNNCTSFSTENLPNTNTNDGSYVVKERHYDSDNGNEIWLYKVVGGDHDWPGASGNMDINSSLEAWLFFELSINNSLSNSDILANNLIISPNPVKERIIIRSDLDGYSYTIYDLNGKKLLEDNKPEINFSNKANGTYFLKIYSGDKTTTKKIIKL
jgi:polyhydroxybutyrate depolymerase